MAVLSLVFRVTARSPDRWLRIAAHNAFDLPAIVTALLHCFCVIAAQLSAGLFLVLRLPSSPVVTVIPAVLLTLLTWQKGFSRTKGARIYSIGADCWHCQVCLIILVDFLRRYRYF
jgi:hypothetical protein